MLETRELLPVKFDAQGKLVITIPEELAGNADAFHSVIAKRGPQIISSQASYMGDDGVNIRGSYAMWISNYYKRSTRKFPCGFHGDVRPLPKAFGIVTHGGDVTWR